MIASLRGKLRHKDAEGVVIDCGGVGYGVAMSLSALARLGSQGSEVTLFIHTHVAQDSLRLYGFLEATERRLFEILVKTSKVGPKLALAVLSTFSPQELADAVAAADQAALVKVPGVGAKKAERLLLELRDRLPRVIAASEEPQGTPADLREDLVSALTNLGFKASIAEQAAKKALESHPGQTDIAILVREALRATTRM